MEFVKPPKLVPGKSTIGLIAPSGVVDEKGLREGIKIIKEWGFAVKLGKNILEKEKDFSAGGGLERMNDLMAMVRDHEVGAVGCIVGGYAALEIIKYFSPMLCREIVGNPKIFFGYSDFSLILNIIFGQKMISFHAPNAGGLYQRSLDTQKSLRLALLGEGPGEIGPWFDWKAIRSGLAEGKLLVSNLEVLINLLGTVFDPLDSNEAIVLALEDVDVNKSVLSRWLHQLAAHRRADKIKGIVLGRFTKIGEKDYPAWGEEIGVEQIFEEVFGRRGIPIAFWPEFGHIKEKKLNISFLSKKRYRERINFWTLPSGVEALFSVNEDACRLKFLEKPLY